MATPVAKYPPDSISTTAIGTLDTAEIAAMTTTAVYALTSTQISQLTTTHINGLTSTQINALSNNLPVKALTTTQIAGLSTAHVSSMTTTFVSSLTDTQIISMTTTQVGLLSTTQLAALSTTQVGAILTNATTTQVAGLTSTNIAALIAATPIGSLADVDATPPLSGNVLTWNGIEWAPGDALTVGGGSANILYNATPVITAQSAENNFAILTLSRVPVTTAEQTISGTATSNTVAFAAWKNHIEHGDTSVDAGRWDFTSYAAVNSVAAGRVTTLTRNICSVDDYSGATTVTVTGTGTSRTATASSGSPFPVGIDNTSNLLSGWLQTPKGLYQITARTSATVVTITVPAGYINESGVDFSTWQYLFSATSNAITSTGTNYQPYTLQSTQPAFPVNATSVIGAVSLVTSNNTTTLTLAYNGTTHNTFFVSAESVHHNDLPELDGGAAGEYYHLTSAQHATATQLATTFTTTQVASLQTTTLSSLTTTLMATLTTAGVAAITTTTMAALITRHISELTTTQITAFTTTQIAGLTTTQLAGLSSTQLSAKRTAEIAALANGNDAFKLPSGTTAQRPGSPANGDLRYNSTLGHVEAYFGGAWVPWQLGTVPYYIDAMVIAGAGGGGDTQGGGGAAGGFQIFTGIPITEGVSYTVTVGNGGPGSVSQPTGANGSPGSDSSFDTYTSLGGGRGGGTAPGVGGSGGGGGAAGNTAGAAGTAGQGYAGGNGLTTGVSHGEGGGGGGATAAGESATGSNGGGAGGTGYTTDFTGTSKTYATGGGGGGDSRCADPTGGAGGRFDGANSGDGGGDNDVTGHNGAANSGEGGGGGGFDSTPSNAFGNGGNGGSGLVSIRYPGAYPAPASTTGSPTYTNYNGYRIYTWTTSGSVTF